MSDPIEVTRDRSLAAKLDEASAASEAQDWPRAAALWDEVRAAQPQDPHGWFKAGEAYSEGRKLDRAEHILGEAAARFPDHRWIAYRYAIVARYAGDFAEVRRRIEKLWHAAPDFWPAWLEYAEARENLGDPEEAEAIRRRAAERFPDEYWPNYAVARLDAERSDPQTAIDIWSTLVKRFSNEPSAASALRGAKKAGSSQNSVGRTINSPDGKARRLTGQRFDGSDDYASSAQDRVNHESFILALHSHLLGRAPSEVELRNWTRSAARLPPGKLLEEFVQSSEYKWRRGVDTVWPPGFYHSPRCKS